MTHAGFIFTAWGVSLAAIAAYCARLVWRGRTLMRRVPEDRRRWMTTQDDHA
ncbi:MAG TPA: hypothetical protein VGQ20_03380 [Acidimicrobiales bacterium]|jgi:heme exporter protein D|nr:hypothetical protein [Acidimicrobiales bacterium]